MLAGTALTHYDGVSCEALQQRAGIARLVAVDQCASTMDLAHQLAAEGAVHGTTVVAEMQGAGRGRTGKSWTSERGAGVWASVLLREGAHATSGVLSLRTGLALATALDPRAGAPVQLKWPNDVFLHDRKLAGILIEARWRGDIPEWIVVGVGVNVAVPVADGAAALREGTRRADVLVDVVTAVLRAAEGASELSALELAAFATRDLAIGRTVDAPLAGTVLGITSRGGVRIATSAGDAIAVAGSLVFRPTQVE